jgi:hypothetical protein
LQTVIRAFIFRKKFFGSKGMKEILKHSSDEIIKKKESEFICKNLMETDAIIKKNFNDVFLNKLQLKKSNRLNSSIRTDCLIKKNNAYEKETTHAPRSHIGKQCIVGCGTKFLCAVQHQREQKGPWF